MSNFKITSEMCSNHGSDLHYLETISQAEKGIREKRFIKISSTKSHECINVIGCLIVGTFIVRNISEKVYYTSQY